MVLPWQLISFIVFFTLLTLVSSFVRMLLNDRDLQRHKREIDFKSFEAMVLWEIEKSVGFYHDITKALDVIISMLPKLVPFSVAGYLLLTPDGESAVGKIFKNEPVTEKFILDVKEYLTKEFSTAGVGFETKKVLNIDVDGVIDGGNEANEILSLWLRPIVVNSRVLGVVLVGSSKSGLYRGSEMAVLVNVISRSEQAVINLGRVIAAEEHKLNAMISSIIDGVLMVDADYNLSVYNPMAAAILGISSKGAIFSDVIKVFADRFDLRAKIEESVASRKVVTVEEILINNRVIQLLIGPVYDQEGKFFGAVILFHDITAKKQLERLHDDFTAMIVHELRAPLTVVRGTTDMLVKNPQMAASGDGINLLKTMENSAVSMLELVNDLLDVAKIEAGKFQVILTKNNLRDVISDRVTFLSELGKEKSVDVVLENMDEGLEFDFDRERISQVLNNLITNAIKFSSEGGRVEVSAKKVDDHVLVSVKDYGEGIPADKIPILFSKFKQLQDGGQKHPGTGLGLVIAKGIVESHKGQINVESKLGEGSTFYFTLPLTVSK